VNAVLLKWIERPDEEASGCVWLEPLDAQTWYLGSLAADHARQNSGLGRRLLAAAEDWIRAHGGTRVRMTVVNVRETLIAWYLRRGYQLTGETEPFPYGDNRFGTPLRDDLSFVVLQRDLTVDSTDSERDTKPDEVGYHDPEYATQLARCDSLKRSFKAVRKRPRRTPVAI
jgi:GNAT superfamily N-acetyltransferase